MRFVFTPPADHAAGLLTLPWSEPLAEWQDERLVEIRQRGISRHVVRFVAYGEAIYALKELPRQLAEREYRLLAELDRLRARRVSCRWRASSAETPPNVTVRMAGANI